MGGSFPLVGPTDRFRGLTHSLGPRWFEKHMWGDLLVQRSVVIIQIDIKSVQISDVLQLKNEIILVISQLLPTVNFLCESKNEEKSTYLYPS
ncbi:Hypothetical predicted protein [Mytilus galloprovincialis]|uniref:Uncharacterized protein n=1 Tax=Mytilus galloprovincialis TaxID=29158 RepID=A0A8B6FYD7_MYTGA|nr:Hypothetical predicted protein [Mytilus galloprovincialis]